MLRAADLAGLKVLQLMNDNAAGGCGVCNVAHPVPYIDYGRRKLGIPVMVIHHMKGYGLHDRRFLLFVFDLGIPL